MLVNDMINYSCLQHAQTLHCISLVNKIYPNPHHHKMTSRDHIERLATQELELGATDAIRRHVSRKVVDTRPVSQRKLDFEHARPRWLREMMAEATGVFFYVYPGIAATAAFFTNGTEPQFRSLFMVGWAYAIGIAFAIITCAPTSGGHFNPGEWALAGWGCAC